MYMSGVQERRHEMSPLEVAFMAAVVFALYKVVDLWIVWGRDDDE